MNADCREFFFGTRDKDKIHPDYERILKAYVACWRAKGKREFTREENTYINDISRLCLRNAKLDHAAARMEFINGIESLLLGFSYELAG
jgi:hypothetical protein